MTFAEKLRRALDKSGMTRSELADKAGISRPMITNYLNGGYKAKQNNIFKLAKALNIPEHDLIEDEYITDISAPAPKEEIILSQHDRSMVEAYHRASDKDKYTVDMVLNEYSDDDLPALAEKEKEELELDFVG